MAGSRPTFSKRQKERARQERAAEKAQKRAERKLQQKNQPTERSNEEVTITYDEDGQPKALDFHDF